MFQFIKSLGLSDNENKLLENAWKHNQSYKKRPTCKDDKYKIDD